ncbi:putative AMP-binding enzyme [Rosellinia necatrix]|uniref:Putative AMP-binding enzyme n=1 Tax=Rosellinia necatrix TaxID=77044 RepID=A0A1W2TW58_ROSNE|nr:putative AMP-binding enzyme [Rosellinia necatrix]
MTPQRATGALSHHDNANEYAPDCDNHAEPPQLITLHARRFASGNRGACICIDCDKLFPNNAQLRSHGKREGHRPYACDCGHTCSQLDALDRHIASKNNVAKFTCPLCKHDKAPRAFCRADHLPQHFRTFHKISAGRIPKSFTAGPSHSSPVESPMPLPPPQYLPSYSCPVPGCNRRGELAYFRQLDLDEHLLMTHGIIQNGMFGQQGPGDPVMSWTGGGSQQNARLQPLQMFGGQDSWRNGPLQPALDGNTRAGEGFAVVETLFDELNNPQDMNDYDIDFGINFEIDLNFDA